MLSLFVVMVGALGVIWVVLAKVRKDYRIQVIMCVIRPEQIEDVTSALKRAHLMMGMTVMNVRGFGRQHGDQRVEASNAEHSFRFLPKLKLEILVRYRDVQQTLEILGTTLRTGEIGDGKIIVFEAVTAMRVRTGERGISAL